MMIQRAILHILDFYSDVSVFSEAEIDLSDEAAAGYISKQMEKLQNNPSGRRGGFSPDSEFLADLRKYRSEELSFAEFSAQTARILHRYLSLAGEERPVDVLFADFSEEDSRFVGFLLLNNDEAYMHRAVSGDGQVKAEIARHHTILPKPSQKTDSYALIRLDSEEIFFTDRKRSIDGEDRFVLPELLLKCTSAVSGREAIKTLQEVAAAVAEKHGENSAVAVSKVKNFLIENAEISGTLAPQRLVREVFGTSEEKQREFLQEIEEKEIPESVPIPRKAAVSAGRKQKIRTDTGIEISVPSEYLENPDFIEFVNHPDGTLSIQLKNIGRIVNR